VLTSIDAFYAEVHGSLQAWSAAPPKLRPAHPTGPQIEETVAASLISADFSSQDHVDSSHDHVDIDARIVAAQSDAAAAFGEPPTVEVVATAPPLEDESADVTASESAADARSEETAAIEEDAPVSQAHASELPTTVWLERTM